MKHEKDLMNSTMESDEDLPTIPEFFKGKSIFLTGGTGFMGKVFIEKLLWSCPDIDAIYILLRPKKGKDGLQRLAELEKSKLYERLRIRNPNTFLKKVKVISGDVREIGLGLSLEDREILVNNVDIVVHSAASVRFDDSLKEAIIMNTRGTREMMLLAREMKHINAFLHISTVYCNTDKNPVEEMLYPPHADWRKTIEIAETMDDNILRILTSKYIDKLPNTYVFTKSLAEHVVNDLRGDIPTIIFRPSIVISSLNEPVSGWVENFNGPVGLLVACGKGIMRSMHPGANTRADYMPVDVAIKAIIVTLWRYGSRVKRPEKDIPVFNSCSSMAPDITYNGIINIGMDIMSKLPFNDILWLPGGGFTNFKTVHFIKIILLHLFPALIIDTLLKINGHKPLLVKVQRRIYIASNALHFYIANEWKFKNEKFLQLRTYLLPQDKDSFYFEFENVDVYAFIYDAMLGARRYLMKEPDDTIPKAIAHFNRMYILDKIFKVLVIGLTIWFLFKSTCVRYCGTELLRSIGIL